MKPKTIYAVSRGCYSDYSIVALFSTRDDAKLYMERHPVEYSDWNEIEEFTLDAGIDKLRKGFGTWWVQMSDDGSVSACEPQPLHDPRPDTEMRSHVKTVQRRPWFNWYGWAKDEKHAVKSANEHRIQLLARLPAHVEAYPNE